MSSPTRVNQSQGRIGDKKVSMSLAGIESNNHPDRQKGNFLAQASDKRDVFTLF